ncbi:MAG: hypothetical protein R3C11_27840 [Planctomycetaceae bacterium]
MAGSDDRGLAYALYEIADAIRCGDRTALPGLVVETCESPLVATRSVQKQIFNEDLERVWYEDEAFWHWYFQMLARNRFNNYTLTFGHNTNYKVPPYAWMFEVPEYPEVAVKGLAQSARAENLHKFQKITSLAQEYGLDFTIGLWTQLPVVNERVGLDYGESYVENLPGGVAGGDYCAKGLNRLLQLCPGVTGVQLRMNLESGIPHDKQTDYYKAQFAAIANCGRPVRLDLRYKSLHQETIDLAKDAGLDVTVSTKYWCEHMGLPFHPTWEDKAYAESRYGYGTMLQKDRNYRVIYRLWNSGTTRLLQWGDPEYAARFAESCTLGGGEGFEVFAPLANKGYGNKPGFWGIHADQSLVNYQWEQERYWPFYLSLGRYGYNPQTSKEIWEREFQEQYGSEGKHLAKAVSTASKVLPLITVTCQFSAGGWRLWPEMHPCMHLDAYRAIQPSDYSQFYAIAPFSSRQRWRGEGWASTHSAFVEDLIQGNLNSKWTPIEISRKLEQLANEIEANLVEAKEHQEKGVLDDAEYRGLEIDLRVLMHLARYHAHKKLAATHLEFFRLTNEKGRLPLVWREINSAQQQWQQMADLTEGKYYDNMVFGFSKEHHSDFPDRLHEHIGHWKDRLDEVQADVDFVAELMRNNEVPLETPAEENNFPLTRYPAEEPLSRKPDIQHERIESVAVGEDIVIKAQVNSEEPLRDVSVYLRPMNQTVPWKRIPLESLGGGRYEGRIPAGDISPRFDFLYYLEARVAQGGTFWPHWETETPYVIVKLNPRK